MPYLNMQHINCIKILNDCSRGKKQFLSYFKDYKPVMELITKFGLVKCMKWKLSLTETKITYSFFHQTFLEYFAARWASIHKIDFDLHYSRPFLYFPCSASRETFLPEFKINNRIPYCAFSVEDIYQTVGIDQKIKLDGSWTPD